MTPLLAVKNPQAACDMLETIFGFVPCGAGVMAFGSQKIAVVSADDLPAARLDLPLDHVAFWLSDVDAYMATVLGRGAVLSAQFTPNGPRVIDAFWENGVKFVFFEGPEGAPIEFCMRLGGGQVQEGLDHFGMRVSDVDGYRQPLSLLVGPLDLVARHRLDGTPPVEVSFVAQGSDMFELFDEDAKPYAPQQFGWVGCLA